MENKKLKIGLQHQHLSENIINSVIGAGSIVINEGGLVTYLDNQSGTFQFNYDTQKKYIELLHSVLNLQNAKIYSVDYAKYHDPTNISKIEVKNKFYSFISYNDDMCFKYKKQITRDKWFWVLHKNNFNHVLYYALNEDMKNITDKVGLYKHFKKFGQYEMGRCVGFY